MSIVVRVAMFAVVSVSLGAAAAAEEGFISLFNGRDLANWTPRDASYWSVVDGAITARITPQHPCKENQYLFWNLPIADFELKLKSRVKGEGAINGGFQFRSRKLRDGDVCGYQVDNNLQTPWLVRLYDEFGRHTLAWRGERTAIDADGKPTIEKIPDAAGPAWFKLEEWHEYHLICVGEKITLRIDGRLAAEVVDGDPRRRELQGALALQLHSGPPTEVQFKDIFLKTIRAPYGEPWPPRSGLQQASRDALAFWRLEEAGHGLQPPLRHVPQWEKFEMNVRPAGKNARWAAKVLLLDGAYLDAGTELHAGPEAMTAYLRCRDPKGSWNSALMAKRGSHDMLHFNLFSVDLKDTPGPDIGFEIRTDRGFAMVSFPVSQIDATAWHDLVGRYDGATLAIYCDGKRMAAKPWSGKLQSNREPLLIGAETDGGKVVRHFIGELEEAGIWSRALSEEKISAPDIATK